MILLVITLALWFAGWIVLGRIKNCGDGAGEKVSSAQLSIIIPARNEEQNLPTLLRSIAAQSAQAHEIIVLDDASTDRTAEVAAQFGARVINSQPLPDGWRGKTWACHQGALAATDYLIAKGHQRIACIQGPPDSSTSMDRVAGYRAAMEQHGVEVDETQIVGDDFSEQNGYVETKLLLQHQPRPTAIFSLGNLPTFGAIRAIAEQGLSIPEDISLLSFDDHYSSAFLAAPLTAVAQPQEEIGLFAVKLLCNQLAGNPTVEGVSLVTQLNERSSVRVLD